MPFQAISWAWRKTDPNATPDPWWHSTDLGLCPTRIGGPPYTSNTCVADVKETGVLTGVTRVNGVVHTDSVCVQCTWYESGSGSTPDSILNSQAVRQAMMEMADSTHGSDALSNRKEQVGMVFRDNITGQITVITQVQDSSNRCKSWWRPITPTQAPGTTLLAIIHTHPTVAGEGYSCPNPSEEAPKIPGPSKTDWDTRANVNGRADFAAANWNPDWYVMHMDRVYKMYPNDRGKSKRSLGTWNAGLCAWVRLDDRNASIYPRNF